MERLEEELTCAICCDIFSEPRVLPCSHTFCRPCLQDLLQPSPGLQDGQSLRCPSCRALVAVPAAGPEALPINFALKAVIEKWRQEQEQEQEARAKDGEEDGAGTCRAHPRQPLNIYCLRDRQLVCGQCLTIGKHRGHAIDDLQSAYRKAREASGQLLQELKDPSRSRLFLCTQRLQQHKAQCQSTVQSDREAVLKYFKELGDTLERKKEALLSTLNELESRVSAVYDPLIQEVEKLKLEESELKELHSALQKEESPLLFLEKLDGLRLRLQALKEKQLPEPEPVEIQPRMKTWLEMLSRTEIRQFHKMPTPNLDLVYRSPSNTKQALLSLFMNVLLIVLILALMWEGKILPLPAPLVYLAQIHQDCLNYLEGRVRELCTSVLPQEFCRGGSS